MLNRNILDNPAIFCVDSVVDDWPLTQRQPSTHDAISVSNILYYDRIPILHDKVVPKSAATLDRERNYEED
ncbi:hypothetical protein C1H76_3734 [Elsinoe australis]|uniref:Uncharacterized protein n=1 Tax=Elsinoe australis TaxID=40998 RepID=A0A4U7B4D6_9PEZI|nr:hypothetical protein C1H76_3734 [Elsinoe australis]